MSSKSVFETPWFSVEEITLGSQIPALEGKPYYRFKLSDGVVVLPVTTDGKIVLIRQYRPAPETWTLEIPAGAVDEGETPEESARRELYEETGYICKTLSLAGEGVLRVDREDANNFFFLAEGCERDPGFVATESIEALEVSAAEFKKCVTEGKFDHIAALPVITMAQWNLGFDLFAQNERT